jgi:type III secretion protein L
VSGRKFLSLLHGEALSLAPGSKVIPAEDFSVLLDSQEALARLTKDEKTYRKEVIEESEMHKEHARQAGFEEGFSQWVQAIAALETEIHDMHDNIQKMAVPLALKAAQKIVGKQIELEPHTVIEIIKNSIRAVAQHKKIVLYVNEKEFELFEKHKSELKAMFDELESLSIRKREDIEPGGCIIETERGIINAQLSKKWQTLEYAFSVLLEKKVKESNETSS